MPIRLYETGLVQVAGGLAALCEPTPDRIEQLANDLRRLEVAALQIDDARLAAAAKEAAAAARFLPMGTPDDHVTCVRALHRVGSILLLCLLERAGKANVFVESRWTLERKILVVDDSRVAAVALSNALVARDFLVRSVATMEEALADMASFVPTILVSDVHMPSLDVGVLCRTFRELSVGRPIRVVLMSSTTGDELEARLREVKPDAFVSKMSGAATVVERVLEMWADLNP
jgi:PleD family two-component response regulator